MELLDLNDYALNAVLKYLDFNSKLQAMATCKKLENLLILSSFHNNFWLKIHKDMMDDPQYIGYLKNIRRNFSIVLLTKMDFVANGNHFDVILELFKKIGSKISLLYIMKSQLPVPAFLKLMQLVQNVKVASFIDMDLIPSNSPDDINDFQFQLKHLWCLIIVRVKNPGVFNKIIGNSVSALHLVPVEDCNGWPELNQIWAKQQNLLSLTLSECSSDSFVYMTQNESILEFKLDNVMFSEEAFKDFTAFTKTLNKVTTLDFYLFEDEADNENDYSEILLHLLNVKTLKNLKIICLNIMPVLGTRKIINPTVEVAELHNIPDDADFQDIVRSFPNITSLIIDLKDDGTGFYYDYDLGPLTSLKHLKKLKISYVTNAMIAQIENLTDLVVMLDAPDPQTVAWLQFFENSKQLESLVLHNNLTLEHLEVIAEKLPNLKHFQFQSSEIIQREQEDKFIDLILEICQRLETILICLEFENYRKVFATLYHSKLNINFEVVASTLIISTKEKST